MKVDVVPSSSSFTDDDADDQNNLQKLLEAFGSAVSLDDIASAYCEAGRNLESTAEMLCNMKQDSISEPLFPRSEKDPENTNGASSGSSSRCISEKPHFVKFNSKKGSASLGTVSDVIGKDYINPRPQSNRVTEKLKPMKLNSNDFPVAEVWGEEKEPEFTSQGQPMDTDLGQFLYKMLGNGFQLEMDVIEEVIGQCGYNMPMSIDKLLDISAATTLEKSDDVIGIAAGNKTKKSHGVGSTSCPKQSQLLHYPGSSKSDASNGDESILPQTKMKNKDIQREVLAALFSAPERIQDHKSTHPVRTPRQSPYGRIVAKPLEETFIEDFTYITRRPINDINNEANEESYDELRKAVLENWATMKEYYKASADAFIKKDHLTAQNLLEQGHFYKRKAGEADELSTKKLIENSNEDEEFCINAHELDPKEALYNLRLQLTALCGLPDVRFMKVVVGTRGDKKDVRRKCLITKLLEEEGIPWTEEGNGWIISVRVDEVDRNKLSFVSK
ncbi:hypothetical protein C2S52_012285 [Perilla frutescens var. hirtella]|nr:hypothetical protein C2S52_012285 [Perilla frutescens var. hirtella]KAH6785145.1 hypothetical protein C2S51_037600 [Perilla frutescens var. frutescens]